MRVRQINISASSSLKSFVLVLENLSLKSTINQLLSNFHPQIQQNILQLLENSIFSFRGIHLFSIINYSSLIIYRLFFINHPISNNDFIINILVAQLSQNQLSIKFQALSERFVILGYFPTRLLTKNLQFGFLYQQQNSFQIHLKKLNNYYYQNKYLIQIILFVHFYRDFSAKQIKLIVMGCIQQKKKSQQQESNMLTVNQLTDCDGASNIPQFSVISKSQKNEVSQLSPEQQRNQKAADYLLKLRQGNGFQFSQLYSSRSNQSRSLSPRNGVQKQRTKNTSPIQRNTLFYLHKSYGVNKSNNYKPFRPSQFLNTVILLQSSLIFHLRKLLQQIMGNRSEEYFKIRIKNNGWYTSFLQ
ncbi:hypothetical protein pb186bvf_016071 [Paramecium bursaria]